MSIIDPRQAIAPTPLSRPAAVSPPQIDDVPVPRPDTASVGAGVPSAVPTGPPPVSATVAAAVSNALNVSSSLVSAPAAAVLSDADCLRALNNSAQRGAEYHRARSFHIPVLMDATVRIDGAQAVKMLTEGREKSLSVKLASTGHLPLRSRENAAELEIFSCAGDIRGLGNPSLGSLLQDIDADGYILRTGAASSDEVIGAYGAYGHLTHAWSGQTPGRAWVWREGVPLVPLHSDAAAHPVEVRDEIRRSRDALADLLTRARTEGDAAKDLALLRAPCGDASFASRADVLDKLARQRHDRSDARVDFNLIAHSRRGGETLEDVAAFFLSLEKRNAGAEARDIHGAFNYTRTKLWNSPALVESFQRIYGETHDINVAVKGIDLLSRPVRGESYAERESFLIADAHAAQEVLSYDARVLSGEQALDDYQYVVGDLRPNETFPAVAGDYLAVMEGVQQTHRDISQVRPAFRYLRDRLASDSARAQDFREIVRQIGTAEESIRALEFLDKPSAVASRDARKEVLVGLLSATHDLAEAERRYNQIERGLKTGEDFGALGKLYAGLLGDINEEYLRQGVGEAFDYARANLAGDADAVERFRKVVREGRSYADAVQVYPRLRQAVRAEDEAERVGEYLRVLKLADRQTRPVELYVSVADNLMPSESLRDGVDQLEALHKALELDRDRADLSVAYVEMKKRLKSNPDEMKIFTRLLQRLESYKAASVARQALDRPVRGEDFAAREAVLDQLVAQEKSFGHAAAEGGPDYATVVGAVVGTETLAEATARFVALLSALRGQDASRTAREAFAWIADNFTNGNFGEKTANEVTAIMVESLLLSGDVATARNRALSGEKKTGTVEKQDDYVIIGGIRVPVQRGR